MIGSSSKTGRLSREIESTLTYSRVGADDNKVATRLLENVVKAYIR